MIRPPAVAPDVAEDEARLTRYRRVIIAVLILVALGSLAIGAPSDHAIPAEKRWFLLVGSVIFAAVVYAFGLRSAPTLRPAPWAAITATLGLAISLFVVGGMNWLAVLAVGAGTSGRFGRTPWPALVSSAACAVAGSYVAVAGHAGYGSTFAAIAIGPLTAFFGYSSGRRADAVSVLRRTRADLARAAVAEERLRIARDLHDLLGHSLSLITLKAELAGRVIGTDPGRAASEIAELEAVARQSLSDVRTAVAGYRQPDLAGELVSARQLLDSAGIVSRISAPDTADLSQAVDAALAWAVREATTNVVRHSRATHVDICVSTGPAGVIAEISDNGPPAPDDAGPLSRPPAASLPGLHGGTDGASEDLVTLPRTGGSGLAGLAERVRRLGGELVAGSVEPHGFRLRVVIPLGLQG
jgi:two-component system, NarL family, sensor histidine kinase DesK